MLRSTVIMESSRSSTQTIKTTSFDIVKTFVLVPFLDTTKISIDLLVKNSVVHNFLRIPQNTFPMLQSTVQMESIRSSTQTITTTSFDIVKTFVLVPFLDTTKIRIYLLVKSSVVHNFLRIPQNTFPMLQFILQMESSRSSTQTIKTTSFDIV